MIEADEGIEPDSGRETDAWLNKKKRREPYKVPTPPGYRTDGGSWLACRREILLNLGFDPVQNIEALGILPN